MRRLFTTFAIAFAVVTPASAHHPLGGMPMETFTHGVLSGFGHPILGFDHLFFIIAVGITAALYSRRLSAPLAYIGAMLIGCLVTALWSSTLVNEFLVACSLLILGSMLLSGKQFSTQIVVASFGLFGLFHGAAFGETLAAQEAAYGLPVLIGYLIGLGVTQYLVAIAAGSVLIKIADAAHAGALEARLAGAMVAGAGLLLVFEHLEGPIIALVAS
ncbi:MAG: HupE/UreJ family protein [Pseudomonadota bacterium]